jgi:peptidoglycan-N-acetylmuramic acid deacetylase
MRKKIVVTLVLAFLTFFIGGNSFEAASGFGWGYKKNENHEIPEVGKYRNMLEKYGAYYADHSGKKHIYLTFDNGYEEGYTDDILNVLKEEKVPATFFVTGHYVKSEPELVKRMADEGHIIGNHSYHHPDFTVLSKKAMKEELESLEQAVAKVSSQKEMKFMRAPRGTFNEQTLKWSSELGYIQVFWSLAFADWHTDQQKGADYAYEQIMKQVHPGAIILLHAVSADNAKALSKVIKDLKKQGYDFRSLDDLVIEDMLPDGLYGL